jgi:hypothetical protein
VARTRLHDGGDARRAGTGLCVFLAYEPAADASRFDFNLPWMPALGINLHFAVDGFNVYLVLLAACCSRRCWDAPGTPSHAAAAVPRADARPRVEPAGHVPLAERVLFFAFWEAVLIPRAC